MSTDLFKQRETLNELDDTRIKRVKPLLPPAILYEELPLSDENEWTVLKGRQDAENIVKGTDDRLLVVVGPCSIHDPQAAIDYAKRLRAYADESKQDLAILMRVYFEKPRTTVGWKGLINDPGLDGSNQVNKGLRTARKLLLDIVGLGLPTACEFLDTITPQFTADCSSWGAIGARTTESQVHRELASGLSMPIGFKNGTDGSITIAIDAIRAASGSHTFLSVTKQGLAAIVESTGNDCGHIILRGGKTPNYEKEHVKAAGEQLEKAGLKPKIMIDCSHGNSSKQHERQVVVAQDIANQMSAGDAAASNIVGVMIESNINLGKQSVPPEGPSNLKYGVSITDACIDWDTTVKTLDILRAGVQARRKNAGKQNGASH